VEFREEVHRLHRVDRVRVRHRDDVGQAAADGEEHGVAEQLVGGREIGTFAEIPRLAGHALERRAHRLVVGLQSRDHDQALAVERHLRRHEHRRVQEAHAARAHALEARLRAFGECRRVIDDDGARLQRGCDPRKDVVDDRVFRQHQMHVIRGLHGCRR
jgi:hypothetical protein